MAGYGPVHRMMARGVSGLVVEHQTLSGHGFKSHYGPFEQVANLRCAQVNSASYPLRDGK